MPKGKKVLILTNKQDITADYVILELRKRNISYFRFNTEDFPTKILGTMHVGKKTASLFFQGIKGKINLEGIFSIWYRRPGIPFISEDIKDVGAIDFCRRESEEFIEGVLSIFKGLWVSYPSHIFRAQNKLYQLDLAKGLGFKIPETIITNNPEEIKTFADKFDSGIIAKAVRQGILKENNEEYLIFTNPVRRKDFEAFPNVRYSPCIFQEFIPKKFDLRVTVIGNKVFPVEIHSGDSKAESRFDWRRGDEEELSYKVHVLPRRIEVLCRKIVEKMGLKFGAIDLISSTSNEYYFLEINPNGQWAWIEQRTKVNLTGSLVDLLIGIEK